MEIIALARYPVKSMGGQSCQELTFQVRGVVGDREWAVLTADGGLGSGKTSRRFRRLEGLLHCVARATGPGSTAPPSVRLPDGSVHPADSPLLATTLSELVGQPVTLGKEGEIPHHDDSPVHVLTTGALEDLGVRLGAPLDRRRFRANVLVDGPVEPGMRLALGDGAVLRIGAPMPRCVMVTMSQGPAQGSGQGPAQGPVQGGLAEDRRVLKALPGGENGPELGFMAYVERAGTAAVGDPVAILGAG